MSGRRSKAFDRTEMAQKGISIRAPNGRVAKLSTDFFRGKDEVGTKLGEKMELSLLNMPPRSFLFSLTESAS